MGIKRLLCISPTGAAAVQAHCGKLRDWDLCIVASLADAARAAAAALPGRPAA